MQAIRGLPLFCKDTKEYISKIVDILGQLLTAGKNIILLNSLCNYYVNACVFVVYLISSLLYFVSSRGDCGA